MLKRLLTYIVFALSYLCMGAYNYVPSLDVYGRVMESRGDLTLVPFRYQWQYDDSETGLYYNRFRYYSPQMGMYISSDPIGLARNNPTLYGYVGDINTWLDVLGLDLVLGQVGTYGDLTNASIPFDGFQIHHVPQDKLGYLPKSEGIAVVMTNADHALTRTYKYKGALTYQTDKNRSIAAVLKDDLVDLHNIGNGKYEASITQIIEEYENLGMLKKGELSLDTIIKSCK